MFKILILMKMSSYQFYKNANEYIDKISTSMNICGNFIQIKNKK